MAKISISRSVGLGAPNKPSDVVVVQTCLNHFIAIGRYRASGLAIDGICGQKTRQGITNFQFQNGLLSEEHFKNIVEPDGLTMDFINRNAGSIPDHLVKQKSNEDFELYIRSLDSSRYESKEKFRREFEIFKDILLLHIKGVDVDDKFWIFRPEDGMGRFNPSNPQNLVQLGWKPAFEDIRREFELTRDKHKTTLAAHRSYREVEKYTNMLFQWHRAVTGTADGSIANFPEWKYLHVIKNRIIRTNPISVYLTFGGRFAEAFNVVLPWTWRLKR